MKRHPFLLLGILAAMSMPDVYVHQRLDAKFKRVLSEKTIERDEKSLDLLQGLLVYLAWYNSVDLNYPCLTYVAQVSDPFESKESAGLEIPENGCGPGC